jgi:hypothetical protein
MEEVIYEERVSKEVGGSEREYASRKPWRNGWFSFVEGICHPWGVECQGEGCQRQESTCNS